MPDVTTECVVSGAALAFMTGKSFRRVHFATVRAALELTVTSDINLRRELNDYFLPLLHRSCSLRYPKDCRKLKAAFGNRVSDIDAEEYLTSFRDNEMRFAEAEAFGQNDRSATQERCCWVEPINDFFDDMRTRVCSILPEHEAKAFRLGEVLESGLLPIELLTEEPREVREHMDLTQLTSFENVRSMQLGMPRPPAPPYRLAIPLPVECSGLRPWGAEWAGDFAAVWKACGLTPPSDLNTLLGIANIYPTTRVGYVANFVRLASDSFADSVEQEERTPTETRRFRIVKSPERTIMVDGTTYTFDDPDAFQLLDDLHHATNRRMETKQLKQNLQITGKSNRLTTLKTSINDQVYLIASNKGPGAEYWLDLAREAKKSKRKVPSP